MRRLKRWLRRRLRAKLDPRTQLMERAQLRPDWDREWLERGQLTLDLDREWLERGQLTLDLDREWLERGQLTLDLDQMYQERLDLRLAEVREWVLEREGELVRMKAVRAKRWLDTWSLCLPQRVANEDLGGYIEEIEARAATGAPAWKIYLRMLAAIFWTACNSARHLPHEIWTSK